jgi:adenylosuccinate synthase
MDIVYPGEAIKVCTEYQIQGKSVTYHPDQTFLYQVTPVYTELSPWDTTQLEAAKTAAELPKEAVAFIKFLSEQIGVPVTMITTGPRRSQGLVLEKTA